MPEPVINLRLTYPQARAARRAIETERGWYRDQIRSGIRGRRLPGTEPVDYAERMAELTEISGHLTALLVGGRQPAEVK